MYCSTCAEYNDTISTAGVGINMTEPCQYPVPIGLEKGYIPDSNIWVTSQINAIRGAKYGRLRGWRGLLFFFLSALFLTDGCQLALTSGSICKLTTICCKHFVVDFAIYRNSLSIMAWIVKKLQYPQKQH
jgi:hypothetical protein